MKLTYWTNFSKRKNSTKQPTSGTEIDVELKDNTSLLNPIFQTGSVPDNVNYCYVADFGRYYYVSGVSHDGPFCLIECECDVLATYKSQIGSYKAFITRSASSYNVEMSDDKIISSTDIVQSDISTGSTMDGDYSYAGSLVVVAIGKMGYRKYVMSMAQIEDIVNQYFDSSLSSYFDTNNIFNDIKEAIQALFCCLGNPGQYVKSVMWFPCDMGSGNTQVPYFGFMSSLGGYQVQTSKERAKMGCAINKPDRYYNDFRDFDNRFTQATIYLPGAGVIPLDPKYLRKPISCQYNICADTGAGSITVFAGGSEIAYIGTQIGVNVPVGGMSGINAAGGILQALNAAIDIPISPLTGLSGVKSGLVSGITNTLSAPCNCMSPSGNMADWIERPEPQISVTRLGSSGLPTAALGRSLNEFRTISTLSGYVQCTDASVDMPGCSEEKDRVNSYLNGGFYYE